MASCALLGAYCLAEPQAGSDPTAVTTLAEKDVSGLVGAGLARTGQDDSRPPSIAHESCWQGGTLRKVFFLVKKLGRLPLHLQFYVLNGNKCFVAGGGMADVYIVIARTSAEATRGLSAFVVNKVRLGSPWPSSV